MRPPERQTTPHGQIRPQGVVLEIQLYHIRRDTALSARFRSCRRGGPCGRPHFPFAFRHVFGRFVNRPYGGYDTSARNGGPPRASAPTGAGRGVVAGRRATARVAPTGAGRAWLRDGGRPKVAPTDAGRMKPRRARCPHRTAFSVLRTPNSELRTPNSEFRNLYALPGAV